MDPNDNQPLGPQSPGSDPMPPTPVPASSTTPDWQKGLGTPAPQPPLEPGVIPPSTPGAAPSPPPASMPGGMPANQPGGWPTQGVPPAPGPAPVPAAMPSMGMDGLPPRKKLPQMAVVGGVILVVLLIVVATYFMFFRDNGSSTDAAKKSSAAANATDMTTLKKVTLTVPETIAGYKARATGIDAVKDYLSDDGTCEFIAGTVPASQLPGDDLNAIIDPQLKQLKDSGATVHGPTAGEALILREKDGNKTFSMPTLNFEFSQNKKRASVHYSAVILSSNERVIINRTCGVNDGNVDAARMSALDEVANKVTITVNE